MTQRPDSKKKIAVFTIEIAARELLAKSLLALLMVRKNYRVYIGSFKGALKLVDRIDSCVFFNKSTSDRNVHIVKEGMGAVYCFLDEEAGPANPKSTLDNFCKVRYKNVNSNRYDKVFTMGNTYKKILESMPQFSGIEIYPYGWPRFDLLRPMFRSLYRQHVDSIKRKFGKFYLFVSSFGFTSEATFKARLAMYSDENNRQRRRYKYKAFKEHIQLLDELSKRMDRTERIIIRPHPSESISDWRKITKNMKRCSVILQGDITPWILAAEGVIQFGSTVAIQAALNNVSTFSYASHEIPGVTDTPVFGLSKNHTDIDKLIADLRSGRSASKQFDIESAVGDISEDIESLSGDLASHKITEEIARIPVIPQREVFISFSNRISHRLNKLKRHFLFIIKKKVIQRPMVRRYDFEKMPDGIRKKTIEANLRRLAPILSIDAKSIRCRQVTTDLVAIEVKNTEV